ncbi:MAG: tetratricopeptide repeat protein, partial [Roseobacter sp.]
MPLMISSNLKRIFTAVIVALSLTLVACSSPEEKAQAHLESGQELLAKNEHVKAGLEFRNAVKFNDKLTDAWIGLSKVEEKAQNWAGLNSALTKVLELDPNHFESLVRMGKLQLVAGNVEKALGHINKANEIKADDSDVLAARAATLLRLNDREGARRDGERALALDTENT